MWNPATRCAVFQSAPLFIATAVCLSLSPLSLAQQVASAAAGATLAPEPTSDRAYGELPDDPGTLPDKDKPGAVQPPRTLPEASRTDKYIAPGQPAPKLTAGYKVLLGLKDAASPKTIFAANVAAGISHVKNSTPNYGTNSSAYAQRFGAAMARGASYSIFSDSIMASVLHEDPRYYRMGKGHKFVKRLAYAATRPLISRTDGGHQTPNFSLFAGHLGASYLTRLYYPPQNKSTDQVLETFGFSFMGSAIDDGINEFLSGALNILHNSRRVQD